MIKEKMRIKLGIDPTASDIHIGFVTLLKRVKKFQEDGHTAVIIIGDFTAMIGDPTGKNKARPRLTRDQVQENLSGYISQIGRFIDLSKAEIRFNSEWLAELNLIELCSKFTVNQILQRKDFSQRLESNQPIGMHELLYPLLQGYDSVAVKADIEIGGEDQLFNLMIGHELTGQQCITMPLLIGLDGQKKMSKSYGNTISVNDAPNDILRKVLGIPDSLIEHWFDVLLGSTPPEDPIESKLLLAQSIIADCHSAAIAAETIENWKNDIIPEVKINDGCSVLDFLWSTGYFKSKSFIRSLISGGAVRVNDNIVDNKYLLRSGDLITATKRFRWRVQ